LNLESRFANLGSLRCEISRLRRRPIRFALAVILVLSALAMTAAMQWILGSVAAALSGIVVVGSTALFGLAAGSCAAALAFLAVNFFFIDPTLQLSWNTQALRCAVGFVVLLGLTHLVERRISAYRRAREKPPLGMQGFLDGVEDGVVSGWALDADRPQQPVLVSLFVNNQPVAEVAAVHYRPDVADTMAVSGCHGFYVDLREHLSDSAEVVVDACFPDGKRLPNAPYVITNPCVIERLPRTIFFMHIPKTAGTAFREAIAANFRLSEIAYIYPSAPGFLVSDLRDLPWKQRRAYRIVIGHYQFGMHEAIPTEFEYITIVRDPVARVLSQYAYFAEHQPELVSDAYGHLMPLEQVLESRLSVDFDNAIVRCFSGVDQNVFPPGALTTEIYEKAVHNLRTAFTFVGHQEAAGDAYSWLCRHFGWRVVTELPQVNFGAVRPSLSVSPASLDSVRRYNNWDLRLYDEICRLFPPGLPPLSAG
jgi:Sulfotransferase family